jgi:hypothetical protein
MTKFRKRRLIQYIDKLLLVCPTAGHQNEIWHLANLLKESGYSFESSRSLLLKKWARYHKEVVPAILRAVNRVYKRDCSEVNPDSQISSSKSKIVINDKEIRRILSTRTETVRSFFDESPDCFQGLKTEELLRLLYPKDSFLCMGSRFNMFRTKPIEEFIQELRLGGNLPYLVPNPMKSLYGRSQEGKISCRCRENAGHWNYQVVEFDDESSRDNQAKFLFELRKHLPLVMVLNSGGKSLHAWFRCPDDNPNKLSKLVDYALFLGADPKIKQPEQLFRAPNQVRDNGNRQQVLYFDTTEILKKGFKC